MIFMQKQILFFALLSLLCDAGVAFAQAPRNNPAGPQAGSGPQQGGAVGQGPGGQGPGANQKPSIPEPAPTFLASVFILKGSQTEAQGALPEGLETVVTELNKLDPHKAFNLEEALMGRITQGPGRLEINVVKKVDPNLGPTLGKLRIDNVIKTTDPGVVLIDSLMLGQEVPIASGASVSSGTTTFDVRREDTGYIARHLQVPTGKPVFIGKLGTDDGPARKDFYLVLSLKLE
jgi:hypothetical protein